MLESFLARLARSRYADDFVLKGGILLAAYGARRPTKDVDANALQVDVTGEGLAVVVREVIAIGQAKWAAWRRKEQLEGVCAPDLDDQVARVAALVDPVFGRADQ